VALIQYKKFFRPTHLVAFNFDGRVCLVVGSGVDSLKSIFDKWCAQLFVTTQSDYPISFVSFEQGDQMSL
jgi:hypothetical protein